MTKASDNVFPRLLISEGGSTTTPAAGNVTVYAKADGLLYSKDDAGTETALGGGSGAPTDAKYVVTAANGTLSAEIVRQELGNYYNETYPGSANATYDDEFDDTTGMSGTNNGLNARWNWRNQSTSTATYPKAGWLTLTIPASSSANFRILEIAALADGTYEMKMSLEHGQAADVGGGMVLIDNTNGDFYHWGFIWTAGAKSIYLQRWTNVTTWAANIGNMTYANTGIYLRVVKSGTDLIFWWSGDGIGWARVAAGQSDAVSADRIGFGLYETGNSGEAKLHVDYFRKIA